MGDPAEFRPHSCCEHQGFSRTAYDACSGKDNIGAVQKFARRRQSIAKAGFGLARQRSIVDLQHGAFDEAGVGGDPVPFGKEHNIPRDNLPRRDLPLLSFPDNPHRKGQKPLQGLQGLLGAVFLDVGKDGIDHNDADDGKTEGAHVLAGMEIIGKEGEPCADPEEQGQEMGKLLQEPDRQGSSVRLPDLVETAFRKPSGGFLFGKAVFRTDKGPKGLLPGKAVNLHGGASG